MGRVLEVAGQARRWVRSARNSDRGVGMRRTIAMIALTTAIVLLGASAAFAWTPGVVDTNDADTVSSLGVSMSKVPWVAWRHFDTDDLFWSRWSGSAWTTTQVEGVGTTAKCLG